jgi:hypothetical protein
MVTPSAFSAACSDALLRGVEVGRVVDGPTTTADSSSDSRSSTPRPLCRSACGWTGRGPAGIGWWLDVLHLYSFVDRLVRTVGRGNGLNILGYRPRLARHLVVWLSSTAGSLGHTPTTRRSSCLRRAGFPVGWTPNRQVLDRQDELLPTMPGAARRRGYGRAKGRLMASNAAADPRCRANMRLQGGGRRGISRIDCTVSQTCRRVRGTRIFIVTGTLVPLPTAGPGK